MLRIRLQRKGRKKRPIWHIVVAEKQEARDGRIVERVGYYDNVTENKVVELNEDRIFYWLDTGAQPSDTVRKILRREGLLYKRHLMNWGKSEEEIEKALAEWQEYRDSKKEDAKSRKADYQEVLAAEEREYKEQLQKKAKQAAAEVEAEKALAKDEDDAPKSDADKIEEALEKAESTEEKTEEAEAKAESEEADTAEDSVEETAAADEETQEESAEKPVDEAEAAPEVVEEDEVEAPEAVEENVAEADEPATDEVEEETDEEEAEDTAATEEDDSEDKEDATSDKVSTDMTAKEAIDHIEETDLDELKGFVPDDEDRVTVQRAWESKQEG